MRIRLNDYNGNHKIVSLALDEDTRDDLSEDALDFLYIDGSMVYLYPDKIMFPMNPEDIGVLRKGNNYDCLSLNESGVLSWVYDNTSIDNFFFVTGKCNSNCIMCPSPDAARKNAYKANIDELILIAQHIPDDAPHLTITGGEPFMAGEDIFRFLKFLKDKFKNTEFLILTNGRIFSVEDYVVRLQETLPLNCILAIPIHAATSELHDTITRVDGSFRQTMVGIRSLLNHKIRVELRVVVSRLNLEDFSNIADLIIHELAEIEYISIIAMEMTGNAYLNRKLLWIPYSRVFNAIASSIEKLINHNIDVRLYNFPLCTVSSRFWMICKKSISPSKVRYVEECEKCRFKMDCGGIFAGSTLLEKDDLRAIE